ncbi:iron complex outermembrane receptor protein [Duganella sp. SG902]|uniref:TonB-dependent siderophore receptor n=1 Tax=Duganella sp. SG902 TaxID=2587016 RepID=UPI00159DAE17|nr:TonB-dependent siderophore receptor [Duganella sp. SG902]NVM79155.1 iron complex outermembrane receptor protein [Duganella sp. SG902]
MKNKHNKQRPTLPQRHVLSRSLQAALLGAVCSVPYAHAQQAEEKTLATVTVSGAVEQTATGHVDGYVAKRSASATKTDTPLIETPQSVSVVTADQIEALGATSLREALGYTPGVGIQGNGYRDADNVVLRGFAVDNSSIRRDGLRSPSNTFTGAQEPFGLERVDVLRGAASLLYGAAEPGGIVNLVTKRPTTDSLHEVSVELGSYQRKQVTGDFGGALNDDGSLAYRFTVLKRDSDTFIDFVPDNRLYVAPALTWKPAAGTSITLLAQYQKSRYNRQWGVAPQGSLLPNPNGKLPYDLNIGEPTDKKEDTHKNIALLISHQLGEQTSLNFAARHSDALMHWNYAGRDSLQDDLRTLNRFYVNRMEHVKAWTMDAYLQTGFQTGAATHQVVLGVDASDADNRRLRAYQFIAPLDLFAPVYGAKPYGDDGADGYKRKERLVGLYAQDQIKIDQRWVVVAGARHDDVKYKNSGYFVTNWNEEKTSATTGSAGLVYLADGGVAPYLSYSQSFQPQSDSDRLGQRFKPTKGKQYEAGVRYQPKQSNTLLSAAVYQLTQSNVLSTDPVDSDYSVQLGAVRARGLELEARTDVSRDLRLIASYTYTDAKITKASAADQASVGLRQPNTPRSMASAWADYQFTGAGLPGLRLGGGVRYVGSTLSSGDNYTVPAYTVLDAGLNYQQGHWKYALNLKNLADRRYLAECGSGYCNYGDPRQVLVTATYRW